MDKKRVYIVLFSLLLLVSLSSAVYAQSLLDPILAPFARLDIVGTYAKYGFVIDAILYFVILVGAARVGLGERMQGPGGGAVIAGVGIALGIGAAVGEYVTGFRLGNLWPLALLFVLLSIAFAAYNYIKQVSGTENRGFAMLAFAFLFFYFQAAAPKLAGYFANNPNQYVKLIWALLTLIALFCLIWGIVELVRGAINFGGGGGGGGTGGGGAGGGGAGGPSLWRRFWDWRDRARQRKENEGKLLDYQHPGNIKVQVVDLHDHPVAGARVNVKGGTTFHSFKTEELTDGNGVIVNDFQHVPAGQLEVTATHPNYFFVSTEFRTRKNIRDKKVLLPAGQTLDLVIRMRGTEQNGEIKGRVVFVEDARRDGLDPRTATGKMVNNPALNIGSMDNTVYAIIRENVGGYARYIPMQASAVTADRNGFFYMQKLPLGKNMVVGILSERVSADATMNTYITHLGIVRGGILSGGTAFGRGGKGGDNAPPPADIFLGKVSFWRRYKGLEENTVISTSRAGNPFGTITGYVVNGSHIMRGRAAGRYGTAADVMADIHNLGRWPRGPGLPNCQVRAVYEIGGTRVPSAWQNADAVGGFSITTISIPAANVVVEARLAPPGRAVKTGISVAWVAGTFARPNDGNPFNLTPAALRMDEVLIPIWGVTLADVRPVF